MAGPLTPPARGRASPSPRQGPSRASPSPSQARSIQRRFRHLCPARPVVGAPSPCARRWAPRRQPHPRPWAAELPPVRPRDRPAPTSQLPHCSGAPSGLHRLRASPVRPSESCRCHPAPCVSTPPPGQSQPSPAARIHPQRPPGRVDNSDSVRTWADVAREHEGPGTCGRRGEVSALFPARLLAPLVSV